MRVGVSKSSKLFALGVRARTNAKSASVILGGKGWMAAIVLALGLAGCGSTTHSASQATVTSAAPSSAAPPSVAPSPLDLQTEGMVCADLSALVIAGNSADPIGAVADVHHITRDQVTQAINDKCPTLKSVEP